MTLGLRIKRAREHMGYQQKELAQKVGVRSAGVISNWERDLNKPDADKIVRLCRTLHISCSDLLDCHDQEDETINQEEQAFIQQYRRLDNFGKQAMQALLRVELERTDYKVPTITLPFFSARPSAGIGNFILDNEKESIELIEDKNTSRADYVLQVDGNSMEPRFSHGEYVLVKKQETIQPDEIGIFVIDGNVWIKQLKRDHLHSLNPDYDDIYFEEGQDIRCMGKVLGEANVCK